jgi:hypothetical protein
MGGVEVGVEGDHISLLKPRNVDVKRLQRCLERIESNLWSVKR